ncbi:MAG: inositol monophosphatase family protein [Acidimicrobiia bacterium]
MAASQLVADLALALELADLADEITLARFRAADLLIETKPDLTPVTEADRDVEAVLRARLADARPGDGVLGEEAGESSGVDAVRRWVIDPIDGTKGYARGIPVWATLIALEIDADAVLGVVSAPALGSRWWAARGLGAFRDEEPISVSHVSTIEDAHLAYSSVDAFEAEGLGEAFLALARRCWRARGFGDFWSYVLVADGSIDIAVEVSGGMPALQRWDLAAPMAVVQEAGGRFTDLAGVARADGGNAVATNGVLHDDVLAALAPDLARSDRR